MLCRVVSDWIGAEGWLSHFEFRMRQMNLPGDVVRARGRVTAKVERDDGPVICLELWVENDRVPRTTPGQAEVTQFPAPASAPA